METQATRAEGKHQIVVRMPVGLHQQLVNYAAGEGISVNAAVCELVARRVSRKAAA